eukprot:IDg7238t1
MESQSLSHVLPSVPCASSTIFMSPGKRPKCHLNAPVANARGHSSRHNCSSQLSPAVIFRTDLLSSGVSPVASRLFNRSTNLAAKWARLVRAVRLPAACVRPFLICLPPQCSPSTRSSCTLFNIGLIHTSIKVVSCRPAAADVHHTSLSGTPSSPSMFNIFLYNIAGRLAPVPTTIFKHPANVYAHEVLIISYSRNALQILLKEHHPSFITDCSY